MTNFDKLIKEKAEQATYPYNRKAWKNFQSHAGGTAAARKFWVLGVSATLIVGSSAGLFLHHRLSNSPTQNIPEQPMAMQDSVQISTASESVPADCLTVGSPEAVHSQKQTLGTAHKEPASAPQDDGVKSQNVKAVEKQQSTRLNYGRPLVIDVDTIRDNVPSDEELKNGNSRIF